MAFGYRMQAISILGREVMKPRGLTGLAFDTLNFSTGEIREVFDILADPLNYPVLIHCTQGKDRTGLIIALVLLLLGAPADAIKHDYVLSESELLPEKEARMQEIKEIDLGEEFAGCPLDWTEKVQEHIEERYGGIQPYLKDHVGISPETQESLKAILSARRT